MATIYKEADDSAWVATGVSGPQLVEQVHGEPIVHFGDAVSVALAVVPHHHIHHDGGAFEYKGLLQSYIKTPSIGTSGVSTRTKVAVTANA